MADSIEEDGLGLEPPQLVSAKSTTSARSIVPLSRGSIR
jgi:hypothetical protein